jgi:hypothetical protein
MDLKLQLLANNDEKTWTLKSKRGNYSIGTIPGSDIELTGISVDVNLKFSFDEYGQIWYISDLGKRGNLLIDGQPLSDYAIQAQSKITVESGVTLNLIPDRSLSAVSNGQSTQRAASMASASGVYAQSSNGINQNNGSREQSRNLAQSSFTSHLTDLKKYTWPQYVKRQVAEQGSNIGMRLTLNFALNTGFRNTPWIKSYGQAGFDGYIIPDFQGSAEMVVAEIERKLGTIRQYEDTDCFVSELTDAHLIDSTTQKFLGIEFFPLRRDKVTRKKDYRRFCVTAYHRVRTYLLVEKYGSDLFVSWVTRFEPMETPAVIMSWLALAFMISCAGAVGTVNNRDAASNMIAAFALPLILWSVIFLLTPAIMSSCSILPKKANARLVIFLLIIGSYMTVGTALLLIFVTTITQENLRF